MKTFTKRKYEQFFNWCKKELKMDDRTLAIYLLTHPNTENELIKKFKLK